jgi:hypothetical protein
MNAEEIRDFAELIRRSDGVIITFPDKKAILGEDLKELIAAALEHYVMETNT